MHQSSMNTMRKFVEDHLHPRINYPTAILDYGSKDVNGTYKPLFEQPGWTYVGVDIDPGANVDVVLSDPYNWKEIPDNSFDVVVSGQSFEHTEFIWETMKEIRRVLKFGGLLCIVAPSKGPEHLFPVDCWRFYPDGMRALCKWVDFTPIEVRTDWTPDQSIQGAEWSDTVLVAEKSEYASGHAICYWPGEKVVFLRNHKTASISMANALDTIFGARSLVQFVGYPVEDGCLRKVLADGGLDSYDRFGFVRNPWSRLVSWYAMQRGYCNRAAFDGTFGCDACGHRFMALHIEPDTTTQPDGRPTPILCDKCGKHEVRLVPRPGWNKELRLPRRQRLWYEAVADKDVSFARFVSFAQSHPKTLGCSQLTRYFSDSAGECIVEHIGKYETLQQDFDRILLTLDKPTCQMRPVNTSKHAHYSTYYDDRLKQIVGDLFERDILSFGYSFESPEP